MPFKDHDRRNEYFRNYMRTRRKQPKAGQEEPGLLNPVLDRNRSYSENARPFPYSALAEQDGGLYDLAT
jgi:hypothetical protein